MYTAVAILVAALVVILVVKRNVEENSKQKVSEHTAFVASAVVPNRIDPSDWSKPLSGEKLDAMDEGIKRDLVKNGVLRVRIYNPAGTIIYSDDRSLIGTKTTNLAEITDVINGAVKTEISSLNNEGATGENRKVIGSYAPVIYPGETRAEGAFEFYTDYALAAGSVRDQAVPLTIALLAVMLALYLALLPMLRRTTRALAFSNDELRRRAHDLKENLSQRADIEDRLRTTITDLERSENQLALSQEETIMRLSIAVESRHAETGSHIERMGRYCALLAERLEWTEDRCELLRIASPLHDVGKIAIPDGVLQKPGALTPEERVEMERHAKIGHRILAGSDSPLLDLAARIALTHHEKWNGSGYPNGLAGDEIPIEGRIAAIADVFDALTSDRVYRPAMTLEKSLSILREGRGTHFDPLILDAFFASLDQVNAIRQGLAGSPEPMRDGTPRRRTRRRTSMRNPQSTVSTPSIGSDADDTRQSLVG
ncbi:MAG: HD domain-containing phosphohydrolase [Solirubrobacterales bacterium]